MGFDSSLLDRVRLQELIQLLGVSPASFVIVVLQGTAFEVADNWITPAWKLNREACFGAREKLKCASCRQRQAQPLTSGCDRDRVADLCFDGDDMGHLSCTPWKLKKNR